MDNYVQYGTPLESLDESKLLTYLRYLLNKEFVQNIVAFRM